VDFTPSSFDLITPLQQTPGVSSFGQSSSDGTIEIATSVGHYPPYSPVAQVFPGTNQCGAFGEYNTASASLGTTWFLPPLDGLSILEVTAKITIHIPSIFGPAYWSYFLPLVAGAPQLGVDGGATAWVNLTLTLHTVTGSAVSGYELVSNWTRADHPIAHIKAAFDVPLEFGPSFPLTQTAVLSPGTNAVTLIVDAQAIAFAEGTKDDEGQSFAQVEFRLTPYDQGPGPLTEFGEFVPAASLLLQKITVSRCAVQPL
jgi:hypothetical protein